MRSSVRATLRRQTATTVGVLVLLTGGVLSGCDADDQSRAVAGDPAARSTGSPTGEPSDPSSTELPDPPEPLDPPSDSTSPTQPETTTPSEPETTTPAGARITAAEYEDDWHFKLGDTELDAKHVRGTDYATCKKLEVSGSLTSRGCRYGVKVTYQAKRGKVVITNMVMEMSSEAKATAFSNDKTLTDNDFNYQKKDVAPGFDKGQWRARSAGKYVVFTVCTGTSGITQKQVKNYLHYVNADFTAALLWR
ncbi:hypothetical protein [Nocardioides jensenii]|uniref:hypothetical protein n=1 Tax=Nocardioides jensenii TaxID=1843 RepID=UPI00082D079A|nr:hypothetical protein [Nocardioides jensenii]